MVAIETPEVVLVHWEDRLVYSSWKFDHVTTLLRQLHWLKAPERINYKTGRPCLQMPAWISPTVPR